MEPSIELTPAAPGDLSNIVALVRAAYSPYVERIGREPAPMSDDYRALIAAEKVTLARTPTGHEATSGIVRFPEILGLIVTEQQPDHLLIENIAVSPAAQGLGIGCMLLEHAYAEARALGLAEVKPYTNAKMTENLSYYPRRGFVEVDRRRESGFDRVYFTRSVAE